MAKQFLINEEDADALLNHLAQFPYKEVFPFCDTLRKLDEAPNVEPQMTAYHQFIVEHGLWEDFLKYSRWMVDAESIEGYPSTVEPT